MDHLIYLQQALQLATQANRPVSPNPYVGCVVVRDGRIVGTGFHQGPGTAHAEVVALQQAGAFAEASDVYVNLEPCCHFGRTPPCINALIAARVKRVFCSMIDPNPLVAGKGVQALQAAGIEVNVGLAESETQFLNRFYIHYIQHRTPYVIAKWAISLDGQMITHPNDDRIISNNNSHDHSHQTRKAVDAILIGVETALADKPALTVRHVDNPHNHQPLRIILDSKGRLPLTKPPGKTLIITTLQADAKWIQAMQQDHDLWIIKANEAGKISLPELLTKLGQHPITSILVEGGKTILNAFINQGLVQETHTYLGAKLIADLPHKKPVQIIEQQILHDNFFCRGIL